MTQPVERRPNLILASASPRRRSLLEGLGLEFRVIPPDFDEEGVSGQAPDDLVAALARGKALAVAKNNPGALVIGADTVVVLGGEILGKPKDAADAASMLKRLSGNTHTVKTGVCIARGRDALQLSAVESTEVTFGMLSEELIQRYVATGEPLDKAGAYGIQEIGATLVCRVNGCYFNVVGLPLFRLARMLESVGVHVP